MRDADHSAVKHILAAFCIFILTCSPALGNEPRLLPQQLLDEGWIQLFDGETLFGWQQVGEAEWQGDGGTITTTGERPGFLMTTSQFASFALHVEFRAAADTNSGVFLRSALQPTDPAVDCYELNIAPPDNPFPTGSFVARKKVALPADRFPKADEWHEFDILTMGDSTIVRLDGRVLMKADTPSPRRGHIGLQANEGEVAFRNIRLRPLGLRPIFNGRDLAGWSTAEAEQSQFDVTAAGELRVSNGPGQIATDGTYADFVLQLECLVGGDGLNSGIFFRTLKGGRWLGYESQIHNGYHDGDRSRPVDFGTGGIYRRQPARRVIPDDQQWFSKTIVADGPHMAVWINGYQASDWTDDRPPHTSPREGRREEPGTIAIQGHDPTTNLLFRNLRIVEMPSE